MTNDRSLGYGLLEAIVALVLLSTTALAFFSWINVNILSMTRNQEREQASKIRIIAGELISSINPLVEPQGHREIGAVQIKWQSTPLTSLTTTKTFSLEDTDGVFQVRLFETEIEAKKIGTEALAKFKVRTLGYRKMSASVTLE